MTSPVPDRLWAEIVYIAYYLHWSFDSILDLDHASRARVIDEIGKINTRLNETTPDRFDEESVDWAAALR